MRENDTDVGCAAPKASTLPALLRQADIANYLVHPDADRNILLAYLERSEDHKMDDLPNHPIMRRRWDHMKDIMHVNIDGSPVATPLVEMFHLP